MRIWKYPIDLGRSDEWQSIEAPGKEARLLSVSVQDGKPVLYALVDPVSLAREKLNFWAAMTGSPVPIPFNARFLGTIQMYADTFVLHVFAEDP